jgi:hypothetical protein
LLCRVFRLIFVKKMFVYSRRYENFFIEIFSFSQRVNDSSHMECEVVSDVSEEHVAINFKAHWSVTLEDEVDVFV